MPLPLLLSEFNACSLEESLISKSLFVRFVTLLCLYL